MMLQMYNPAFVRRVWAKRRKGRPVPEPTSGPTLAQIVAESKRRKRLEQAMRREQERREKMARSIQIAHSGFHFPDRPNVKGIIASVAVKHGVSFDGVVGASRNRQLVAARHEAMVEVCTQRPDLSLPQIGKAFGGRDHTTILHALKKAGFKGRSAKARHEMLEVAA